MQEAPGLFPIFLTSFHDFPSLFSMTNLKCSPKYRQLANKIKHHFQTHRLSTTLNTILRLLIKFHNLVNSITFQAWKTYSENQTFWDNNNSIRLRHKSGSGYSEVTYNAKNIYTSNSDKGIYIYISKQY